MKKVQFKTMKDLHTIIGRAIDNYRSEAANKCPQAPRFCYPIESGEATQLLLCEYKNTVEARGKVYRADSETARRLQSIATWLTNRNCKPSLLLCGALPGTGKTTTATAILRMAQGLRAAFNAQTIQAQRCREAGKYIPLEESEKNLLSMCEAAVIVPSFYTAVDLANIVESNRSTFEAAQRCNFLIIDDLGTEPVSRRVYGNEVFPIIEILQYRYANMLPTIITSNFGLNKIAELYGPRISDRLRDMCEILFYTQEESYRR